MNQVKQSKVNKVLKCKWCERFVAGYDEFCDDDCFEKWIGNIDIDGNKSRSPEGKLEKPKTNTKMLK